MLGIRSGMFFLSLPTFAKLLGGGFEEVNNMQKDKQNHFLDYKKKVLNWMEVF